MSESNLSILIVEDDPMIRSFLKAVLEAEDYDVTEAESGAEMFAALDGKNFDVIVLDIMLPDGNGVDFARTLRRPSTLPIIFATAVTDTNTRRRAIGLMQVDYVTKPFDAQELLLRIKNIRTMAPVMEDPNARDLPKPVAADTAPWYRSPLTWGPAVAFLVIVLGGVFLIPDDEDPAALRAEQSAAQVQRNADTATAAVQAATDAAAANAALATPVIKRFKRTDPPNKRLLRLAAKCRSASTGTTIPSNGYCDMCGSCTGGTGANTWKPGSNA